nr:MAG TPA: hypothetical protein [Caudoviricetes sp.]
MSVKTAFEGTLVAIVYVPSLITLPVAPSNTAI